MVRGQHPQTKIWSLKGKVLEMVHGDRAVNVELYEGRTRLFARDALRKDTTRAYQEQEEEELRVQLVGEVNLKEQQQGREKQRRRGRNRNMEDVEPRRSARLAKKKVTVEDSEQEDDPKELPSYMEAVENGYAGTTRDQERKRGNRSPMKGNWRSTQQGRRSRASRRRWWSCPRRARRSRRDAVPGPPLDSPPPTPAGGRLGVDTGRLDTVTGGGNTDDY